MKKLIIALALLCPLSAMADSITTSVYTCGNFTVKYTYHGSPQGSTVHAMLFNNGRLLMQTRDNDNFSYAQGMDNTGVFNISFIKNVENGYNYTLVEQTTMKGAVTAQLSFLDFANAQNGYIFTKCTVKSTQDFNA